jgi:chromosome partitioning related protein ParA
MKVLLYKTQNTTESRAYSRAIREKIKDLRLCPELLNEMIPDAVAYKKSLSERVPVHWYDPHKAGQTMHRVIWELIPSLNGIYASSMSGKKMKANHGIHP